MNYNNPKRQKTAGIIRYSCGILFCLFSFCYLFFMQGELLAQAQFVYSRGVTNYSLPVGAFIITTVLQIFQWIVARIAKLPSRWYALSYFPSFLGLAMLTHFDEESIIHFSWGSWAWLVPLLLLLYVVVVVYIRGHEQKSDLQTSSDIHQLTPNFMAFLLMALLTAGTCPATDVYMYELKAERLMLEERYDEALEVGDRSLQSSQRLTNLRMYALSRQDSLAEHLFDYPQAFAADGLLTLSDSDQLIHRLTSKDIALSLGMKPGKSISTPQRYFQLVLQHHTELLDSLSRLDTLDFANNDSLFRLHQERLLELRHLTRRTADYYLCSLLLNRDVMSFVKDYGTYYTRLYPEYPDSIFESEEAASLPVQRAYREALAVGAPEWADSLTLVRRQSYVSMRDSISNPTVRQNLTHRRYGNTFWWYLDNPD